MKLEKSKAVKLLVVTVFTGLGLFGLRYVIYQSGAIDWATLYEEAPFLSISLQLSNGLPITLFWPLFVIEFIVILILTFFYFRSFFETAIYIIGSFAIGPVLYAVYYYTIAFPGLWQILESMGYPMVEAEALVLGIALMSFFGGGLLGFYLRRGTFKGIADAESAVLNYIKSHQKIQISECAIELGITVNDVENALKSLNQKGLISVDMTKLEKQN